MSFSDLDIRMEYRSLIHNVANEFLIPTLREAVSYDRAVGFFSSSILASIAYGIEGLALNGGKIRLVCSPYLSDEDKEAIKQGYADRDETLIRALNKQLTEPKNYTEQEQLNLLANLISDGILDIRIAFIEDSSQVGMYHEKLGIIKDKDGNTIAFSGSMNESNTALTVNYEAIDVFCSWKGDEGRTTVKENAFASIWNNTEPNIIVIDYPEIKEEIIHQYRRSSVDYKIKPSYYEQLARLTLPGAKVPEGFKFHKYQDEAIDKWMENDSCGIFDMATGTGKTYTGLGAVARLNQKLKGHLAVVIVAPYQHLVEQWVEDIEKFSMNPIIGYSSSSQKDWRARLEKAIRNQKLKVKGFEFFCFICTNATYSSDFVQECINKIKGDSLIVVDEAHNFGAENLSRLLNPKFKYRLALSATLERHNDETGTKSLFDYFGGKCIEYGLERAIQEHKLTRYKYYPVFVNLSSDELKEYCSLTKQIRQCIKKGKDGKSLMSERGKRLALRRARLVSAAKSKLDALREAIYPYKNDNNILVYCGAASLKNFDNDLYEVEDDEVRQIDAVTDLLGNQLGMKVSQYTSKENIEERKILKNEFAKGASLQALVAIKCLDEGVNIPCIRTAFILASTTNPKEYIQRRGRVLRLYDGKDFAYIYDFITLPESLGSLVSSTEEELKMGIGLIKNELSRAFEFAKLADNFVEANMKLDEIREIYQIMQNYDDEEDDYEYI